MANLFKSLGITGTKHGMNERQFDVLLELLWYAYDDGFTEFRHCDCVGVDGEAHNIAEEVGYEITIHPPKNDKNRAFCDPGDDPMIHSLAPEDYHVRDRAMVDAVSHLIVIPHGQVEELRSGTWTTYRYAKKINKPYLIIFP